MEISKSRCQQIRWIFYNWDAIASKEKVVWYKMMKQKAQEGIKRWTEAWFISYTQNHLLGNSTQRDGNPGMKGRSLRSRERLSASGPEQQPKQSSWEGPDVKGVECSCWQGAYLYIVLHTCKTSSGKASLGRKVSNCLFKTKEGHFREKILPCGERHSMEIDLVVLWLERMLGWGDAGVASGW